MSGFIWEAFPPRGTIEQYEDRLAEVYHAGQMEGVRLTEESILRKLAAKGYAVFETQKVEKT